MSDASVVDLNLLRLEASEEHPNSSRWRITLTLSINAVLILYTALLTLKNFPNSADEYAQYISASLFSEGRLSVPSPDLREFFDFTHVINDGRFYGKYPPGWPFLLSIGIRLGVPWAVNLTFGSLTVITIFMIAKENFTADAAHNSLWILFANPLLIFNSASYFTHPSCQFFIALFLLFYFRCLRQPEARGNLMFFGGSLGAALMIRPYTAITFTAPFLAFFTFTLLGEKRNPKVWVKLTLLGAPILACLSCLLWYNFALTGNPLLQPFSKYQPEDHLGMTSISQDWTWGLKNNLGLRLLQLGWWSPGPLLIFLFAASRRETWADVRKALLTAGFTTVWLGYFFYLFDPGNQYGPRYLYECLPVVCLVGAAFVPPIPRILGRALVVGCVLLNCTVLIFETREFSTQVHARMNVFQTVRNARLSHAVVFLATGSGTMPAGDLTRNGIYFDRPVLYVHDLGEHNNDLLKSLPGRRGYKYSYDETSGTGRLEPLELH